MTFGDDHRYVFNSHALCQELSQYFFSFIPADASYYLLLLMIILCHFPAQQSASCVLLCTNSLQFYMVYLLFHIIKFYIS